MLSRTLGLLQSLLFPQRFDGVPNPPTYQRLHKRRRVSATPPAVAPLPTRKTSLDDLNADVFLLIADELQLQAASLRSLASSSRKLRSLAFARLFARCRADVTNPELREPPETIRPHVRHLTHYSPPDHPLDEERDLLYFETLLGQLPFLNSLVLEVSRGRIPWAFLKSCFVRSRIVSLTVDIGFKDLKVPLYPQDDIAATPMSLQKFSFTTTVWREWTNAKRGAGIRVSMHPVFDFERACLTGIVLQMRNTVKSLSLPVESAPILAMAELSWPCLEDLSLHGRFLDAAHASSLQHLLPSLPSLRNLSIVAARVWDLARQPILPKPSTSTSASTSTSLPTNSDHSPLRRSRLTSVAVPADSRPSDIAQKNPEREQSPAPLLSELRSLKIAYPDPDDDIFSLSMPHLAHLSLRDHPRVYHQLAYAYAVLDGPEGAPWAAPLLSPDECLSILQRMHLSNLTSLELVYMVPDSGSDDALLSYIAQSLPKLEHLELHRYRGLVRADRPLTGRVQHTHIARLLSAAKTLRTVRLNLDFHEDHQAYCTQDILRERWLTLFRDKVGPEIVEVMQACPLLEYVALLYHGWPAATWAEFHPEKCAEPRFVLDYHPHHVDSEPCERQWEGWY